LSFSPQTESSTLRNLFRISFGRIRWQCRLHLSRIPICSQSLQFAGFAGGRANLVLARVTRVRTASERRKEARGPCRRMAAVAGRNRRSAGLDETGAPFLSVGLDRTLSSGAIPPPPAGASPTLPSQNGEHSPRTGRRFGRMR
jgi:hypothetical protein